MVFLPSPRLYMDSMMDSYEEIFQDTDSGIAQGSYCVIMPDFPQLGHFIFENAFAGLVSQ